MKEFKTQFISHVSNSKTILVTSHLQPDDDSIASVLVLYHFLKRNYPEKIIEIRYTAEVIERWKYFEHYQEIQFVDDIGMTDLEDFDLIIVVDTSKYGRVSRTPEVVKASRSTKICIDHHASPADDFDLSYIQHAPATTYLLYELFFSDLKKITSRLAELLILGIWGDTGGLRYVEASELQLYSLMGELVKTTGKTINEIESKYQPYSEPVFIILQEMLRTQTVQAKPGWGGFVTAYLSRDFVVKNKLKESQVHEAYKIYSGLFLTTIASAGWGALLYPNDNGSVGISLRSRPEGTNVRKILEGLKIGGGHDLAAGGTFRSEDEKELMTEECLARFIKWLEQANIKN